MKKQKSTLQNCYLNYMSYTIIKKEGLDKEYYGHDIEYDIDFTFEKQICNVTIEVNSDNQNKARLSSNTDGYHWLQFFLCQEPNCVKMLELSFADEVARCEQTFNEKNIIYEQEGKNTAWLHYLGFIDETFVKLVAEIIEPRFANRERFFND